MTRRGQVLVVLGLLPAAAYVAGHYLAMRDAVGQVLTGPGAYEVRQDGGLAEDMAGVRAEGGPRGLLAGFAALAVTCLGLLSAGLRGRARTIAALLAGAAWLLYPVVAVRTLGQLGRLMLGDGGNTGFPHDYAGWLPWLLLALVAAAVLQATGLLSGVRRYEQVV